LWAGVLAWWILGSTAVWAQQESAPREDSPAATSPETEPAAEPASDTRAGEVAKVYRQWGGKIEQVGPDTYILLDEQGNPQPVLNMRYEEFRALWEKQQALSETTSGASRPYTLDELQVSGHLETNHAALDATIS